MSATRILVDNLVFPEDPRWHDGRLWFSDVHAGKVMTTDVDGRTTTVVEVPARPSGLGWLPNGDLLIVADKRLLRFSQGRLELFSDLSQLASPYCNDMVVDAQGRAYVGNVGFDLTAKPPVPKTGALILVTPDGQARVVARDLAFPNGTVVTPDGHTLIVGESFARASRLSISKATARSPTAAFGHSSTQWDSPGRRAASVRMASASMPRAPSG